VNIWQRFRQEKEVFASSCTNGSWTIRFGRGNVLLLDIVSETVTCCVFTGLSLQPVDNVNRSRLIRTRHVQLVSVTASRNHVLRKAFIVILSSFLETAFP